MQSLRSKLLRKATERFLVEGFYKISMDELSSDLKMSKKTIYELFPSKRELVRETTLLFLSTNAEQFTAVLKTELNSIEKLYMFMERLANTASVVSNNFLRDIETHMPDLWQEVDSFRSEKLKTLMREIITQGRKEKVFKDYPDDVLIDFFVTSVTSMVTPRKLLQHETSLKKMIKMTMEILIKGITTDKGLEIFKKFKESSKYE